MAAQAGGDDRGSLLAVIGDEVSLAWHSVTVSVIYRFHQRWELGCLQDTVTGFLLAGVGNVDLRRKSNFLVVTESKLISM